MIMISDGPPLVPDPVHDSDKDALNIHSRLKALSRLARATDGAQLGEGVDVQLVGEDTDDSK